MDAFLPGTGAQGSSWRLPEMDAAAASTFPFHKRIAQTLEAGRFDTLFMNDGVGVLERNTQALRWDPLTLLPALAVVTERDRPDRHASYNEPCTLARRFAARSSSRSSPACGTVGRMTPRCATRRAASGSTPARCTCSTTRGRTSPSAAPLGGRNALIWRNHGHWTVGATVEAAAWRFIAFDDAARGQLAAGAAGRPIIPATAAATPKARARAEVSAWLSFLPLWDRIVREEPDMLE